MSSELRSKLPDDPRYWDDLALRINADAAGPLAAYAGGGGEATGGGWYRFLARRAPWLVAASAAAALILWLALPARDSIAIEWMERSLTPEDGAARASALAAAGGVAGDFDSAAAGRNAAGADDFMRTVQMVRDQVTMLLGTELETSDDGARRLPKRFKDERLRALLEGA